MGNSVLVVDDEAPIRRIVALQLRRAGFTVKSAADGREALDAVGEAIPDLVITDWQMPRMGGSQLCEELQDRSETRTIPVLVLTARGFEMDTEQLRSYGNVVGLLCKPFSPEELLSTVESALGGDR